MILRTNSIVQPNSDGAATFPNPERSHFNPAVRHHGPSPFRMADLTLTVVDTLIESYQSCFHTFDQNARGLHLGLLRVIEISLIVSIRIVGWTDTLQVKMEKAKVDKTFNALLN